MGVRTDRCRYAFIDGTPVAQLASNDNPYAHWGRLQPQYATYPSNNCARATNDSAYDMYIGDASQLQQTTGGYYTRSSNSKFGWQAVDCNALYHYVCELPEESFMCESFAPIAPNPPVTPPPPPPPPPMVRAPMAPLTQPACKQ
jgi:hypothetical protein